MFYCGDRMSMASLQRSLSMIFSILGLLVKIFKVFGKQIFLLRSKLFVGLFYRKDHYQRYFTQKKRWIGPKKMCILW